MFLLLLMIVCMIHSSSARGGWLDRIKNVRSIDEMDEIEDYKPSVFKDDDVDDKSSPRNNVPTQPYGRPHLPPAALFALPKAPLLTLLGGWFLISLVKELRLLVQEVAESGLADLDGNGLPPAVGAKSRRRGPPQNDLDDVESFMKVRLERGGRRVEIDRCIDR
jgi:hypothetical protein